MVRERFKRFVRGYINFSATGGFSETFFRECKKNSVVLYNVCAVPGGISATVKYTEISKIQQSAKKSGMDIYINKRAGFPYLISRYRLRLGVPVGIVLGFVIFAVLSSVVWSVEISGNETVSEYEIIDVLSESGVKVCAFIDNIDCKAVELDLSKKIGGVVRATVNIFGCKVFVDITEATLTPEIVDEKQYTNIVASKDGEIVRCDVLEGEGEVSVGTPVVKGDLLVSGVETLKDNTVRYVHSKAIITARTNTVISTNTALNFKAKMVSDVSDRYSFYLFGIKIPLWFSVDGDSVHENRYFLDTSNTVFPLGLIRNTSLTLENTSVTLTEQQGRLICLNDFALKAMDELSEATVLEYQSAISISNQVNIETKYICEENIAQELVFEVEEE